MICKAIRPILIEIAWVAKRVFRNNPTGSWGYGERHPLTGEAPLSITWIPSWQILKVSVPRLSSHELRKAGPQALMLDLIPSGKLERTNLTGANDWSAAYNVSNVVFRVERSPYGRKTYEKIRLGQLLARLCYGSLCSTYLFFCHRAGYRLRHTGKGNFKVRYFMSYYWFKSWIEQLSTPLSRRFFIYWRDYFFKFWGLWLG